MNSPYWFEVAVMFGLLTAGHIVFDRFARGVPKWLRFVKAVTGVGVGVLVSATLGRFWFFALLGLFGVALVAIHGWLKGLGLMLVGRVNRIIRPRLKLH